METLITWLETLATWLIGGWMWIYESWCEMFSHLSTLFTSGAFALFCFAIAAIMATMIHFIFHRNRFRGSNWSERDFLADNLYIIVYFFAINGIIALIGWGVTTFYF